MKFICENLETPLNKECDVLVVGGGFAGISAALAASRKGAKVILVEKAFMLGGLGTAGLIACYLPICDGIGHQVSFGIAEELIRLSAKYGVEKGEDAVRIWLENKGTPEEKAKIRYEVQYNPQLFAISTEQLLLENKVEILYGTSAVAAHLTEGRMDAVMVENVGGRSAIGVKTVVDASGDAILAAFSREDSMEYRTGNTLAAWYYYNGKEGYGLRPLGFAEVPGEDENAEGSVKKLTKRRFLGLDGDDLSAMTELSHGEILKDLKTRWANGCDDMPVTMATTPQIRMTRGCRGEYVMKIEDDHRYFEDSVGIIANWRKRDSVFEVPFSTMHGTKVKNLIFAGRAIGAEDLMWDVLRVIPCCAVTGEAAGVAAAMFDDFTKADVKKLQKELEKNQVKLHYDTKSGL